MATVATKALTQEAPLPPLEKGKVRLYSMLYCPYAQRARIVLAHHNVPFEAVNINLRSKPEWFFDKNPNGTVPVYEKDGQVLYESRVVADYVDEVYGNGSLYPADPYLKAKAVILMENYSKITPPFYKMLFSNPGEENSQNVEAIQKALQFYEDSLENKFFAGASVGMVDYILWPHIERLPALGKSVSADLLPKSKFPKLAAWFAFMEETPGVKATRLPDEWHLGYIKLVQAKTPNYDYGL